MMDQDSKAIAKSAAKAMENITDIANKIIGPGAEQLGLIFGDRLRVYRLGGIGRIVDMFCKAKQMIQAAHLDPHQVSPSLFLPMIDNASIQDDESLHSKWAALLANSAVADSQVLPAFIEILKQLSPAEAQFLDRAFDEAVEDNSSKSYAPSFRDETVTSIPSVMLGNVYRLGLITRDTSETDPMHPFRMRAGKMPFYFSPLGSAFVVACRPPITVALEPSNS